MIGSCAKCGLLWDGSQEDVSTPGSVCPSCHRDGWRPNGIGGIHRVPTHPGLPVRSAASALLSPVPCLVDGGNGYFFIHDEERPDRLYSEGLLPRRHL